jgi:hypothetical protein
MISEIGTQHVIVFTQHFAGPIPIMAMALHAMNQQYGFCGFVTPIQKVELEPV